mgnify:CR=1 FL=1
MSKAKKNMRLPTSLLLLKNCLSWSSFFMSTEVKKNPAYKFTPVIMLTTEGGDDKKRAGQEGGAKAWIVKPFQPAQMLAAVAKLIM